MRGGVSLRFRFRFIFFCITYFYIFFCICCACFVPVYVPSYFPVCGSFSHNSFIGEKKRGYLACLTHVLSLCATCAASLSQLRPHILRSLHSSSHHAARYVLHFAVSPSIPLFSCLGRPSSLTWRRVSRAFPWQQQTRAIERACGCARRASRW